MKTTLKQPNFAVSREDGRLISQIVKRAMSFGLEGYDRITCDMDLCATHNNSPLDLKRLLEADDFNFGHDIFGIARHINRETGEMLDCFVPRFTKPAAKASI